MTDDRHLHRHRAECHGMAHGIEDLRYPVTVMAEARQPHYKAHL